MKNYPLLFNFRDLIGGNGFVADVQAHGLFLLEEEDDGDFWLYGVRPGGVAGGGKSRDEAFIAFKKRFLSVVFDIAAEADSYTDFAREVTRFFDDENSEVAADWNAALAEVRRTNTTLDGVATVKAQMHKPAIRIVEVDLGQSRPSVNAFDTIEEAA